jgi:hypothetical protein
MPRTSRHMLANTHTHTSMAARLTPLSSRMQHWSRYLAPTDDPLSISKFRTVAPRSSMPSWSTRLAGLSTPSQATRAVRRCSRRGTAPKLPPSTGTDPVPAWFFVGRSTSAKSGCHVLTPILSTCSCSFRTLRHSELGTGYELGLVCSRTAIRSSSGCRNPIVAS